MKAVIQQLKDFIKSDFEWKTYLWTLLFIALAITINYLTSFENKIIYHNYEVKVVILRFFGFYSFAYFSVLFPKLYFQKRLFVFNNPLFWGKSLLFLALISITSGFRFDYNWFSGIADGNERFFVLKLFSQLKCIILYTIP